MGQITRERPSRRKHYRIQVPIGIIVEGKEYDAIDWSLGGFRIMECDSQFEKNTEFVTELIIPFNNYQIRFHQKARVIRSGRVKSELAAEFLDMETQNADILSFFIEGLLSGELEKSGDTIRRMDVTLLPEAGADEAAEKKESPRDRRKRYVFSSLYVVAGLVATVYLVWTLYSSLFRLEIDSALLIGDREVITTPLDGKLDSQVVPEGGFVRIGDPMLVIDNPSFSERLHEAEMEVADAALTVAEFEAMESNQRNTMKVYRRIGDMRLESAQKREADIRRDLELAEKRYDRLVNLSGQGFVSQNEIDAEEQLMTRLRSQLREVESERRIAMVSLESLDKGLFFTADRLVGDINNIESSLESARKRLVLARRMLETVQRSAEMQVIKAPYDARIVSYHHSQGTSVSRGQPVALLEKAGSPHVKAYLSQNEAKHVRIGDHAGVYVPSLGQHFTATVQTFARRTDFRDEETGLAIVNKDRTLPACVHLFLNGPNNGLESGLPVVVNFSRTGSNGVFAKIRRLFAEGRKESVRDAELTVSSPATSH